ncbi:MAG: hypothetical protein HC906_08940 [Bacteroidales bacterium]|nr:hypothetical protein [Bacteroidales bacterium]
MWFITANDARHCAQKTEPLYGRASLIIRLQGLRPGWITEGITSDAVEAVNEYALWGEIPRYWEIRNHYNDLSTALHSELFDKDSIFFEEPLRLLADDMRTSVQAYSILSLIGQGCHKLSEIASRLGRPSTDLSKPLSNLVEMGYVKKEIPFGESEKAQKKSVQDKRFIFQILFPVHLTK